ncbi:MAG TPA: beta galactosidase jelly roll domain-containing protein, partial [Terriglobia bacterium]|nr:beta galactosidase jelly roll domain-containing protein [Terriglobia bacterium]
MKRTLLIAALTCALAVSGRAQTKPSPGPTLPSPPAPSGVIGDIPGRNAISLDGQWHSIVDPSDSGDNAHYERDQKPKDKSDRVEYSFDSSPALQVPGDWNSQRPELMFYEGLVWYRRLFSCHKSPDTRVFLYFGGANYQTRVFLNGTKVGEHAGGFTPFNFEVTNILNDG